MNIKYNLDNNRKDRNYNENNIQVPHYDVIKVIENVLVITTIQ